MSSFNFKRVGKKLINPLTIGAVVIGSVTVSKKLDMSLPKKIVKKIVHKFH